MKESDLVKRVIKALRGRGGFWFKLHGGAFQMAGLPDIVGCYRGRFVAFEVKLPSKRNNVSKRQRLILRRIRHAKGTAAVVWSARGALDTLVRVDMMLDSDGGDLTPADESSGENPD